MPIVPLHDCYVVGIHILMSYLCLCKTCPRKFPAERPNNIEAQQIDVKSIPSSHQICRSNVKLQQHSKPRELALLPRFLNGSIGQKARDAFFCTWPHSSRCTGPSCTPGWRSRWSSPSGRTQHLECPAKETTTEC